jgi:predicted membrane protein
MKQQRQNLCAETRQNTRILFYWTAGWVISLAVVAFGPTLIWGEKPLLNLAGILFNLLIGIGMIFANKRYINGLDELQRKVQLEAMALALGVAVVVGISYSMLDVVNLVAFDAEISHLVMVIGITYLIASVIGNVRYR